MSGSSTEFVHYVLEQLSSLHGTASGRFFGGVGLSVSGTQFGMIMGNTLFFVVDNVTRPTYEAMGGTCFSYGTKRRRVEVKKYFSVPAEVLEDKEQLVGLAKEAIAVAKRLKDKRRV